MPPAAPRSLCRRACSLTQPLQGALQPSPPVLANGTPPPAEALPGDARGTLPMLGGLSAQRAAKGHGSAPGGGGTTPATTGEAAPRLGRKLRSESPPSPAETRRPAGKLRPATPGGHFRVAPRWKRKVAGSERPAGSGRQPPASPPPAQPSPRAAAMGAAGSTLAGAAGTPARTPGLRRREGAPRRCARRAEVGAGGRRGACAGGGGGRTLLRGVGGGWTSARRPPRAKVA